MKTLNKMRELIHNPKGFTQVLVAIVIVIVADSFTTLSKKLSHHDNGCSRSSVTLWHSHQPSLRTLSRSQHNNRKCSDFRFRCSSAPNCCDLRTCGSCHHRGCNGDICLPEDARITTLNHITNGCRIDPRPHFHGSAQLYFLFLATFYGSPQRKT